MFDWQKVRLEIAVTSTCNLKCPHCYAEARPGKGERMTAEEIEQAVSDFAARGGSQVSFSGGEPTLQMPELLAGIRSASNRGLKTTISSNGWWGTPKKLDRYLGYFAEAGLMAMGISFDTFHFRGGAKWKNVKAIVERSSDFGIMAHIMWAGRAAGEALHAEVASVVGEADSEFVLYHVFRFGRATGIGRGQAEAKDWTPVKPECTQTDSAIVILLPGHRVSWRCEARNPAFVHKYSGDWTKAGVRLEYCAATQCRISQGLGPLIARADHEYSDGCSLCFEKAEEVYHGHS